MDCETAASCAWNLLSLQLVQRQVQYTKNHNEPGWPVSFLTMRVLLQAPWNSKPGGGSVVSSGCLRLSQCILKYFMPLQVEEFESKQLELSQPCISLYPTPRIWTCWNALERMHSSPACIFGAMRAWALGTKNGAAQSAMLSNTSFANILNFWKEIRGKWSINGRGWIGLCNLRQQAMLAQYQEVLRRSEAWTSISVYFSSVQ